MGKLFNVVVRVFLLAIVYYGGADIYLIDREIADINSYEAILISLVQYYLVGSYIILHVIPLGSNSNFLCYPFFSLYFYHGFIHLFLVEELHFYI